MEEESGPILIECDVHGERPSAVVCVHLLRATTPVASSTDAFRTFNDMRLVCDGCYGTMDDT